MGSSPADSWTLAEPQLSERFPFVWPGPRIGADRWLMCVRFLSSGQAEGTVPQNRR